VIKLRFPKRDRICYVRLNKEEMKVIDHIRKVYGFDLSGAIRFCIRFYQHRRNEAWVSFVEEAKEFLESA